MADIVERMLYEPIEILEHNLHEIFCLVATVD